MKTKKITKRIGVTLMSLLISTILTLNSFAASTQDLGKLGADEVCAMHINNKGQIVGQLNYYTKSDIILNAYVYSNGQTINLGKQFGDDTSSAYAINNKGQIVGDFSNNDGRGTLAFSYLNGVKTTLPTLTKEGKVTTAIDVNDNGIIIGNSEIKYPYDHAFKYDGTTMTDLGTLRGIRSEAVAINSSEEIIGNFETADGDKYAFLYSNGVMKELFTEYNTTSYVTDINDNGDIVGNIWLNNDEVPFVYRKSTGKIEIINTAGYSVFRAQRINNKGQISGVMAEKNSRDIYPFLLDNNVVTKINIKNVYFTLLNDSSNVLFLNSDNLNIYNSSSTDTNIDKSAPTKPSNLKGIVGKTSMSLTWEASSDNVGVAGYDVYKKSGTKFVKVASVTSTSYTSKGLKANTAYSFYVKAKDSAGNVSLASTTLTTKTKK